MASQQVLGSHQHFFIGNQPLTPSAPQTPCFNFNSFSFFKLNQKTILVQSSEQHIKKYHIRICKRPLQDLFMIEIFIIFSSSHTGILAVFFGLSLTLSSLFSSYHPPPVLLHVLIQASFSSSLVSWLSFSSSFRPGHPLPLPITFQLLQFL